MKKPYLFTFNLEQASANWSINPRTLSKRFKAASIRPNEEGKFTIAQINSAVFGDKQLEELRKIRLEGDLIQRKIDEMDKRLIPAEIFDSVLSNVLVSLRQAVTGSQMPEDLKARCLSELRDIRMDSIFPPVEGSAAAEAEPQPDTEKEGSHEKVGENACNLNQDD